MHIKINNGQIEKYPYSYDILKAENPQTSFPAEPSKALLAEWDVYPVQQVEQPTYTYKQNIVEDTPIFDGNKWVQVWSVTDKPQIELDAIHEQLRSEAYQNESDPLFFKYQRGEVEKQVWLDKVTEIKARYVA